jgi:hypothetical protein
MLQLRLLPPRSYRLRNRPPEWEVTDETGAVVGWIEQRDIPTSSRAFYSLRAVHPVTGERLERLSQFRDDPDRFHMHYPSGTRAHRALEGRLGGPAWELKGGRGGRHG